MNNSSLQSELHLRFPINYKSLIFFAEIGGSLSFLDEQVINVILGDEFKEAENTVWSFERLDDITKLNTQRYLVIGLYDPSYGNIEFGMQYVTYPKVELDDTLEFRDSAISYDSQNNVFERERIFLDTFSLDTTSYRLSYSYIF